MVLSDILSFKDRGRFNFYGPQRLHNLDALFKNMKRKVHLRIPVRLWKGTGQTGVP